MFVISQYDFLIELSSGSDVMTREIGTGKIFLVFQRLLHSLTFAESVYFNLFSKNRQSLLGYVLCQPVHLVMPCPHFDFQPSPLYDALLSLIQPMSKSLIIAVQLF